MIEEGKCFLVPPARAYDADPRIVAKREEILLSSVPELVPPQLVVSRGEV